MTTLKSFKQKALPAKLLAVLAFVALLGIFAPQTHSQGQVICGALIEPSAGAPGQSLQVSILVTIQPAPSRIEAFEKVDFGEGIKLQPPVVLIGNIIAANITIAQEARPGPRMVKVLLTTVFAKDHEEALVHLECSATFTVTEETPGKLEAQLDKLQLELFGQGFPVRLEDIDPTKALDKKVDAVQSTLLDPQLGLPSIKAIADNLHSLLADPEKGLVSIKAGLDALGAGVGGIRSILTDPNTGLPTIKITMDSTLTALRDTSVEVNRIEQKLEGTVPSAISRIENKLDELTARPGPVPPTPVSEDPCPTVTANAETALELFMESKDIPPVHNEVPTGPRKEPEHSTKQTTISAQSAGMLRGIYLTTLATDNLTFFKDNVFCTPEGLTAAETALNELNQFLQQNKDAFMDIVMRNKAFLEGDLISNQDELATLQAAFANAVDPAEKGTLEGKINLTNLRILKLKEILRDIINKILDFLRRLGP